MTHKTKIYDISYMGVLLYKKVLHNLIAEAQELDIEKKN